MSGWKYLLLCALVSLLLFSPVLLTGMPFLCDDYAIIATNIEDGNLDPERMALHLKIPHHNVSSRYYRPVFYLSYALDYLVGRASPFFYYLMNTLYHAGAAWFLFMLLVFLGADRSWAMFSAAIFLCFPVHIEAVAWIAGRSSSLSVLFALGALTCFAWHRRSRRVLALACACLFFGLGLLTREAVIILPCVMLAMDLFVFRNRNAGRARAPTGMGWFRCLAPYFAAGAVTAVYLVARANAVGSVDSGYGVLFSKMFEPERMKAVLCSLAGYLVPSVTVAGSSLPPWVAALMALPCPMLLVFGLWRFFMLKTARRVIAVGVALFVLAVLPGLPILEAGDGPANTRFFYFPFAGLCALLAAGAVRISGPAGHTRRFTLIAARAALAVVVLSGAGLTMHIQGAFIEAGDVCKGFLSKVRASGVPVMMVPRLAFFPYADKDGDGIKNDEDAGFVPVVEKGDSSGKAQEPPEMAILINAPRMVEGVYVFWGGLDMALLPVFGRPHVAALHSELSPKLSPQGSFLGPLILDGVPVLKWDGSDLIRVKLDRLDNVSFAGRDIRKARVASLGKPGLLTKKVFPSEAFAPKMTLPAPGRGGSGGAYRYRTLTPFGPSMIEAKPEVVDDLLVFDPWNEPVAGSMFRAVDSLRRGVTSRLLPVHDFKRIHCVLFIEKVEGERVLARSGHILFQIDFED